MVAADNHKQEPAVMHPIEGDLIHAQALRYAEDFSVLWGEERNQRRIAEERLVRLDEVYEETVRSLARALELRDDQTGQHADRVTEMALSFAERVAPELVADPQLVHGFLLHDLGKIGIPDAVLQKPGRLTRTEMEIMRQHPTIGEQILAGITSLGHVVVEVVGCHHERWDGNGYPRGLVGEEIPLAARIFSLVDAFDAMAHDRPYRKAMPVDDGLREIEAQAGRQFDRRLAREFVVHARERQWP
jgi:HD-GYP domain-containing protein (c-di-GMP phosphodiesterase class II)